MGLDFLGKGELEFIPKEGKASELPAEMKFPEHHDIGSLQSFSKKLHKGLVKPGESNTMMEIDYSTMEHKVLSHMKQEDMPGTLESNNLSEEAKDTIWKSLQASAKKAGGAAADLKLAGLVSGFKQQLYNKVVPKGLDISVTQEYNLDTKTTTVIFTAGGQKVGKLTMASSGKHHSEMFSMDMTKVDIGSKSISDEEFQIMKTHPDTLNDFLKELHSTCMPLGRVEMNSVYSDGVITVKVSHKLKVYGVLQMLDKGHWHKTLYNKDGKWLKSSSYPKSFKGYDPGYCESNNENKEPKGLFATDENGQYMLDAAQPLPKTPEAKMLVSDDNDVYGTVAVLLTNVEPDQLNEELIALRFMVTTQSVDAKGVELLNRLLDRFETFEADYATTQMKDVLNEMPPHMKEPPGGGGPIIAHCCPLSECSGEVLVQHEELKDFYSCQNCGNKFKWDGDSMSVILPGMCGKEAYLPGVSMLSGEKGKYCHTCGTLMPSSRIPFTGMLKKEQCSHCGQVYASPYNKV